MNNNMICQTIKIIDGELAVLVALIGNNDKARITSYLALWFIILRNDLSLLLSMIYQFLLSMTYKFYCL